LIGHVLCVHVLLELFCEPEKTPNQVLVLSPQFGIVYRFRFLAKHLSQFSTLNAGFHAYTNPGMTRPLLPMSGNDHEFNLEPIAGIIMTPRWQASALRQPIVRGQQ
jgi:hypothetical protein